MCACVRSFVQVCVFAYMHASVPVCVLVCMCSCVRECECGRECVYACEPVCERVLVSMSSCFLVCMCAWKKRFFYNELFSNILYLYYLKSFVRMEKIFLEYLNLFD